MSPVKQANEFERSQETDEVGSEERLGGFSSLLLDQRPTDQGLRYETREFCTQFTNHDTLFGELSRLVVSTRRIVDVALKWLGQFYVELLVNEGPG